MEPKQLQAKNQEKLESLINNTLTMVSSDLSDLQALQSLISQLIERGKKIPENEYLTKIMIDLTHYNTLCKKSIDNQNDTFTPKRHRTSQEFKNIKQEWNDNKLRVILALVAFESYNLHQTLSSN